jgi:hypothetical protein
MFWKRERGLLAHHRFPCSVMATQQLVIGGLALALLALSACQQQNSPLVPHSMTPSQTPLPLHRNHVTPGTYPLFVRITFTETTTYEQATATLQAAGQNEYPWTCDDPRTPVPPPLADRRAAFAASNFLLISYPMDDNQLDQLAASAQVVSVDAYPVYMCA